MATRPSATMYSAHACSDCRRLHLGWNDTPLELLIDHIEHVIRIAGIDHVGLGSDFDGTLFLPEGMKDVSQFPNITIELLRRGHSEEAVRQVLGENALRVLAAVESTAETEAGAKPAAQQGATS